MSEYTKTSVHNHFGGEGADKLLRDDYSLKTNFNLQIAFQKIDDAHRNGYGLLGFTNSNTFDPASYILVRYYAKQKLINLLPGIEINVRNNKTGKYLHVVTIFDTKYSILKIGENLRLLFDENKQNMLTLEQFLEMVVWFRCIVIPHGIKQGARSSVSNPETLSELISLSDSIPVVVEDNAIYHRRQLIAQLESRLTSREIVWLEESSSVSSADRTNFSDIVSPTFIWGSSTFDDLFYSCFMSGTRIKRENDIINKVNYISRIDIRKSHKTQIQSTSIICSHGLNTVIGPSGSGKTLLLDIIKRKLTGKSLVNKTISKGGDYSSIYDINDIDLLDCDGAMIDKDSGYEVVEGENLYNKVIAAYQSSKETMFEELGVSIDTQDVVKQYMNFNEGMNSYRDKQININENREEIIQLLQNVASTFRFLTENYRERTTHIEYLKSGKLTSKIDIILGKIDEVSMDLQTFDESRSSIQAIADKFRFGEQFKNDMDSLFEKSRRTIYKKILELKKELNIISFKIRRQDFIFENVQRYNNTIGKQSALIVTRKQELQNTLQRIWSLLARNVVLKSEIVIPTIKEKQIEKAIHKNENDIVDLDVKNIKMKFSIDELKEYFVANIGSVPKVNKSKFGNMIVDLGDENSVKEFVDVFIREKYKDRIQFTPELETIIQFIIKLKNVNGEFEDIDTISAGSLSKIYINKMFEGKINKSGSNVIILYDQPDSNMEKTFILNDLVPMISSLRDKYQVFITTHEPLLVVNADSNNIITSENEKTVAVVNNVKYSNRTFVGSNSKQSLVIEVAKLIDGHPNAIKLRNTIYGGLNHED